VINFRWPVCIKEQYCKDIRRIKIYAIILSGGKQYKVEEGSEMVVGRVEGKEGDKVTISDVNLVCDGEKIKIGKPILNNVVVEAEIKKHLKGDKVVSFKYKPKKRYRRKVGNRQLLTLLHFDKISIK